MINLCFGLIIFNFLLFINFKKLAKFVNIFDKPDRKLKLHKVKTPIVGGFIFALNFFIIFFYQIFFLKNFLSLDIKIFHNLELFSLLILIFAYFFLGLYDDKYKLNPLKRLILSISIILFAIFLNENLLIKNLSLSFYKHRIFLDNLSIVFTIFCILILTNSLNFYDGINGQSCFIFIYFFTYLLLRSDFNLFYLTCIVLLLIVVSQNLKNMLFLGDSGVYLMSIILSISLIYEHNIHKSIVFADEIFFLLLLPGLDLLRLTISRSLNKKNPLLGDRQHIHHLFINKFSLLFSNIILLLMSILPLFLFVFLNLNFFIVFSVFLVIYIFSIQYLKLGAKS